MASSTKSLLAILLCITMVSTSIAQYNLPWPSVPDEPLPVQSHRQSVPAPTKSTCDQTIDTINKCANIATTHGRRRRLMDAEAFTFISTPQCCQAVSDFHFKCLSKHRDAFPPDFNTFASNMCFGTPIPPTPVKVQPAPQPPAPKPPASTRPAPQTPVPNQPVICCPEVVRAMNNPRCLTFPTPQDRDCCCKALYDFDSYCYQFYPNQFAPQFLQHAYQVCWPQQMPVQPQPEPRTPVQAQPTPQIPSLPSSDPVITQCQQAIAYVKNAQCSNMQEVHGRRLLSFSASSWSFSATPDCCKAVNDYNYLCRSFFPDAFPENFLYSATMSCQ